MDAGFQDIVKRITAQYGLEVLDNKDKCESLLQDFANGKYKPEIGLFLTVIKAGFHTKPAQASNSEWTENMLAQDYAIIPQDAEEMIAFLGTLLDKPAPAPEPQSAPTSGPDSFVLAQGGTFLMGSPPDNGYDGARPQHQVTVSPFLIGKYQVTQGEYTAIRMNPSHFTGDALPVEQVSWHDAIDYCNRRSLKEGLTPVYARNSATITMNQQANGYRLPTEAEWEYAARGGNASQGYTYAGSNDPNAVAWYGRNSGGKTHRVGTKAPNELGLYDMSGNVWEWCWDWYSAYPSAAQTNPLGAVSGAARVFRGGSWNGSGRVLGSACRFSYIPSYRDSYLGFRLARTAP